MRKISVLLLLLLMMPVWVFAAETVNTVYVDGKAPIIIDGDLSDWNFLNITPIKLEQFNKQYSNPEKYEGESDLSASFICFSDENYVYVGVVVTDDILIFGEAPIGRPYWDDCIEILFFGSYTGQTPGKIWVSSTKEGKTKLEGREPIEEKTYPYLWEKQGVKARLKPIGVGYVVEAAIPHDVLSLTGWNKGEPLGMNVGVYDDDDNNMMNSIIGWTNISDKLFNEIAFSRVVKIPDIIAEQENKEIDEGQELEVVLGNPDHREIYEEPEVLLEMAKSFEKAGLYNEAIEELKKVIKCEGKGEIQNKAKLVLARNYFFISDYEHAVQVAEELINSDVNSKIALDAKMILLSIERKTKLLKN